MGQLTSILSVSTNTIAEIFMIQFLSSRGPTPYTTEIFPGGAIGYNEEIATVRNKFKWAITNQSRFERAMRILRGEKVTRCLSPCMLVNLDIPTEATKNPAPKKAKAGILRTKPSILRSTLSHEQRSGLGTLERLVSARYDSGEEEIMAFDVVKSQQLKNRRLSKRTRSRPEPALRFEPEYGRRQAKSVSIITEELPPIQEIPSEVVVESIPINKKPKRAWPSRDAIGKVLKDPTNKPTTYFLARFRKNADSEFVEVEYRLNRLNRQESFSCQGSLLSLLEENVQAQYESDKLNNNLDEMTLFFKHAPHFFNKLEGRIWFNAYFMTCENTVDARMKLKSLEMDPPTIVFDMSGLKHISATRNFSRLNLKGNCEGDDVARSFTLRGKSMEDMKSLKIIHEPGTVFVSIVLPFISGIPVSTSKKDIEVEAE